LEVIELDKEVKFYAAEVAQILMKYLHYWKIFKEIAGREISVA